MNSKLTRNIKGFNPFDLLEIGEGTPTVGPSGKIIPGTPIYYLPAKVRQDWYNMYCAENKKKMTLTTDIVKLEAGLVIIKASLQDVIEVDGHEIITTIATGIASQFIEPGSTSSIIETCETRAKARCLGSAGFSLPSEYSIFDEGEMPVDGAVINRRTACVGVSDKSNKTSLDTPEKAAKKKRGRPKKDQASGESLIENAKIDEINQEETFEIPPIEKITDLIPKCSPEENNNQNNGKIKEKDILTKCLKAFFPYGQYKGQQVIDVITQKKFKDTIDKMAATNYESQMVNDELSVNTLIQTLYRYLNLPTSKDRLLLLELVSELKREENKGEY